MTSAVEIFKREIINDPSLKTYVPLEAAEAISMVLGFGMATFCCLGCGCFVYTFHKDEMPRISVQYFVTVTIFQRVFIAISSAMMFVAFNKVKDQTKANIAFIIDKYYDVDMTCLDPFQRIDADQLKDQLVAVDEPIDTA